MTEVRVTGLGAVSCHGIGVRALWSAMSSGTAQPATPVADPVAAMDGALIHAAPDPAEDGPGKATRLALAAAREALADAGLAAGVPPSSQVAVVLGSCMGEAAPNERGRGPGGWRPAFQIAATLGERWGLSGANISVANACAAGGFALGAAADLIRAGEADVVLVGGADAYSRVGWASFDRLGAVDPVRCRPFDRHRAGTVLGEGAGVLVLESAAHADRRGVSARARLTGVGWSCDAHHATAPEPSGTQIVRAIRGALSDARTTGDQVGAVVPHGTGTRQNDQVESAALAGTLPGGVPLYNLKALLGHTGGASAALGAVAAALLLREGALPANPPLAELDPDCPVFLPTRRTPLAHPRVLVNAYAFGGNNASILLEGP